METINVQRRRFLGRAAMAAAGTHLGLLGTAYAEGAPEELVALARASEWLNTSRPSLDAFAGKVVVVDFCTYTCINWLRTLPYVRAWAEKYRQGLVVVGVHTPEFSFERNVDNVRRAIRRMNITYPIVIDNDYAVWRAFDNHYWPALYVVDAQGRVRHHQFGEGEYERSETTIQQLLTEAGFAAPRGFVSAEPRGIEVPADWQNLRSPENYVGYERTEHFVSTGGADRGRRRAYAAPKSLVLNQWALTGEWNVGREAVVLATANGSITYRFHARDLHLVMGPPRPGVGVRFRVSIDRQPPSSSRGIDVDDGGNGTVTEQRLYQLVRQRGAIVDRQFEIQFADAGVEAFAFTFG